ACAAIHPDAAASQFRLAASGSQEYPSTGSRLRQYRLHPLLLSAAGSLPVVWIAVLLPHELPSPVWAGCRTATPPRGLDHIRVRPVRSRVWPVRFPHVCVAVCRRSFFPLPIVLSGSTGPVFWRPIPVPKPPTWSGWRDRFLFSTPRVQSPTATLFWRFHPAPPACCRFPCATAPPPRQ